MKKRWQVLLSVVLVMVLSVSFSVPVFASDVDLGVEDVIYITEEELQEYKASEDDFLDVSLFSSFPTTSADNASATLTPYYVEIASSSAGLQGLVGVYNPTTNDITLDNLGRPGMDNALYCSGRFYFRVNIVDISSQIASGACNAVTFTVRRNPSYSLKYYSYQSSKTQYYCTGASPGFWAIGSRMSVDNLVPIDFTNRSVTLPLSSIGYSGVYCLWWVQPFESYTYVLPTGLRSLNTFTYTNFSYDFSGAYQPFTGELTPSDILNQTDEINNNFTQQTQQQTDTLTTGYDNSGMNSSNDKLSSSLTEYDNTESQVMDQSVQYIDAVTFFDPTTHLQLMSCITYTSTFLQNLFVALGDWSVLVLIALSLAFALMLIGWFKYRS